MPAQFPLTEKQDGFNLPPAVKTEGEGYGFLWDFNALFWSIY